MPQSAVITNLNAVYRKTDAGVAEVKDRTLGLRAELRRLLILMDGVASVERLSTFVRASEIEFLISELELYGLVTTGKGNTAPPSIASLPMMSIGTQANPPSSGPLPVEGITEPTSAQVQAVRRTAIATLNELLGSDGETLAVKIERCATSIEMRAAINEARQVLDRQLGLASGQRFIDAVRGAAESTR